MATKTNDDLYAFARVCLSEWERLKPRIQRPRGMASGAFESALRALVIAYCLDKADPGNALEAVVSDDHLRAMVLGSRSEIGSQSLLEEGLRLLGVASIGRTMALQVAAVIAKNRVVLTGGSPSASDGRGSGEPKVPERASTSGTGGTARERKRLEAAEKLGRLVLTLRDVERTRQTQSFLDRRQRGSSWLAKSYGIVDPGDSESRFIFSWIALNALFGAPRECCDNCLRTERERWPAQGRTDLMWFVRMVRDHDSEGTILTCLNEHWQTVDESIEDKFLVKDYWDAAPEESVKSRRGDDRRKADRARSLRDPEPILQVLLAGRLKTLRNQLIHGAATDRHTKRRKNPREEALFARQADLLEDFVGTCLEIMESVNSGSGWPCIPDPRYETVWHRQRRDECPLTGKRTAISDAPRRGR